MKFKRKTKAEPDPQADPQPAREPVEDGLAQAAGKLLASLKNMRRWMERNKLHMPPVSLAGMDRAIADAEKAGIKVPGERP